MRMWCSGDPEVFAPDPEAFRPERWLESEARSARMDAASLAWGAGARVCLGKDIATFEMYKLLPKLGCVRSTYVLASRAVDTRS